MRFVSWTRRFADAYSGHANFFRIYRVGVCISIIVSYPCFVDSRIWVLKAMFHPNKNFMHRICIIVAAAVEEVMGVTYFFPPNYMAISRPIFSTAWFQVSSFLFLLLFFLSLFYFPKFSNLNLGNQTTQMMWIAKKIVAALI